jgi:hypothetical protein
MDTITCIALELHIVILFIIETLYIGLGFEGLGTYIQQIIKTQSICPQG